MFVILVMWEERQQGCWSFVDQLFLIDNCIFMFYERLYFKNKIESNKEYIYIYSYINIFMYQIYRFILDFLLYNYIRDQKYIYMYIYQKDEVKL